jgi:hypothetical protein
MENVFNKTCYFIIGKNLYRGKILKNKKNKYVIKTEKDVFNGDYDTNIHYIKKNEVIFKEVDLKDFIANIHNNYLIDVITNKVDIYYYKRILRRLHDYFPKNVDVIDLANIIERNNPEN